MKHVLESVMSTITFGDYPQEIVALLESRNLKPGVLQELGVGYATRYFRGNPDEGIPQGNLQCLAFCYKDGPRLSTSSIAHSTSSSC